MYAAFAANSLGDKYLANKTNKFNTIF